MQVKVLSSGFELKDGVFHFNLQAEVLGDTPAQYDLLDFAFSHGKAEASVNAEDFDHPQLSLSVFVSEEAYKAELKAREDAKNGVKPAEEAPAAPAESGAAGSSAPAKD